VVLAFYQHSRFSGERASAVVRPFPSSRSQIHSENEAYRTRLMTYFSEVTFDRHGFMRGEYLFIENGLALVTREGEIIRINSCSDDISSNVIESYYASLELRSNIESWLKAWNEFPLLYNMPCLAEPYCGNYYHYSLDLVPRLRFLTDCKSEFIALPRSCAASLFQRSLLSVTLGTKSFLPLPMPIRVIDPHLAHGVMTVDAVGWLRRTVQTKSRSGLRRLYIRRSESITRTPSGGGIAETAEFISFLGKFGFETVELGNGEFGVGAQVAMLRNAGIILAAHGAALTNVAYLNPPLTIIEIFGQQTLFAGFMHIADSLSFDYHGIISETIDEKNQIIIDCDYLTQIMLNI
jgi:hypothetical protein